MPAAASARSWRCRSRIFLYASRRFAGAGSDTRRWWVVRFGVTRPSSFFDGVYGLGGGDVAGLAAKERGHVLKGNEVRRRGLHRAAALGETAVRGARRARPA